jgi:hypothetical protein
MLISGMLLFTSEATKLYYHEAFWVKMISLLLAMLFTFTVMRKVALADPGRVGLCGAGQRLDFDSVVVDGRRLRKVDRVFIMIGHEWRIGAGYRRVGIHWRTLHPATLGRRLSRADDCAFADAGSRRARNAQAGGAEPGEALSFAAADLMSDAGWPEAVAGCDFVLHVASPFPPGAPKHEDELIVPAREGALRVLRAARDAGVKRVVLTSSFAAIGYGQEVTDRPFTEENWTDPNGGDVGAYVKSKTLAERAAWDFIAREGGALELSVVSFLSCALRPRMSVSE